MRQGTDDDGNEISTTTRPAVPLGENRLLPPSRLVKRLVDTGPVQQARYRTEESISARPKQTAVNRRAHLGSSHV